MPSPGQKLMMSGKPQGLSLFQQVLAICAGGTVITADRYVLDGVSGKLGSFQDWLDGTHLFSQAVSTSQVALPTANAALGNALCANFTRAEMYTSSRAATAWNYLNTGHTIFIVGSWSSLVSYEIVFEAGGGTANGQTYFGSSGPNLNCQLHRGGVNTNLTISPPASGGGYFEAFCQQGGGSPEQSLVYHPGGTPSTTPTLGGTAGPVAGTAVIGNRPASSYNFGGKLRAIVIAPRQLNASEMTTVRSWIQADTGIAP